LLGPEIVGERLEVSVASDGGLGAALGAIGEIEVFELTLIRRGFDLAAELVGELVLLCDGGKDGLAVADELAEIRKLFLDIADLDLVECACRLLAVASDERDRSPFIEQDDGVRERAQRHVRRWAMWRRIPGARA
jgi:hypothetical protein